MILLATVAAALAFSPSATFPGMLVQGGFVMPSGNIACNVGTMGQQPGDARALACTVYSKADGRGNAVWWMKRTGRALSGYVKADPATDFPKLAYGKTYTWKGFRCTSSRTGLTCKNLSGRGFFLSRERQRVF